MRPRHTLEQDAEDSHSSADPGPRCASAAGCSKVASPLARRPPCIPEFFLQIARKQRADERTRTADLISSYEFAAVHAILS